MNQVAFVLALLTFFVAGGFGLYGHSHFERHTSAKTELDQLGRKFGECRYSNGRWGILICPNERMEALHIEYDYYEMRQAEENRNIGFVFAVGGPIAIWLFVLFWRGVVIPGARKGAVVGRIAADKFGDGSARAVNAAAKMTDSAQGRTRECPFCAEMIKPHAKICRLCGKDVA